MTYRTKLIVLIFALILGSNLLPEGPMTYSFGKMYWIYHYPQSVEADENRSARIVVDSATKVQQLTSTKSNARETFILTNTGNAPLLVEISYKTCGCINATLAQKRIEPGQSSQLHFEMRLDAWGNKIESVTLKTNDPAQPTLVLKLEAKLPPTVVPTPSRITFRANQGQAVERYLSLLLPENAEVDSLRTELPYIRAQLSQKKSIPNGIQQWITIKVDGSAPKGSWADGLVISLKNGPVPQITLPIDVTIDGDISIEPDLLFFGEIATGSVVRKTFIVRSRSGKDFRVQSGVSNNSQIQLRFSPAINADAHALEVIVQAGTQAAQLIEGDVQLTFSTGDRANVTVDAMTIHASRKSNARDVLLINHPAPNFTMLDTNQNTWKLSDLRGKNVLLTFFPKCFTGGCAGQLGSLQAMLPQLQAEDVQILAVSVDPVEAQRAFAVKLGLGFPLISDVERRLSLLYGAAQVKTDMSARQSVLIDKQGIVRWIDTNVNVQTHGADVLAKMRELDLGHM